MDAEKTANTDAATGSGKGRYLAVALVAAVGVAAGLFANKAVSVKETAPDTQAETKQIEALQSTLSNATVFPSSFKHIPEFNLSNHLGEQIDQSFFANQWSMVFFGFTHCPDICPTTMMTMNAVMDKLDTNDSTPMQVVFVSVDPKRDTVEVLGKYMNWFNPAFTGITGELADILKFSSDLSIVASYSVIDGTDDYLVDHTASMLLVDPKGRVRAKFGAPHKTETIVDDYKKIIKEFSETTQS